MAFYIQCTNLEVDEQFIRILFQNAFDEDLISHIVQNDRSFVIYFKQSNFSLDLFRKDILDNGFAYFSFKQVYNQYISDMEYIIYTSPNHSIHNSSNVITWSITLH
jgi:hypothetical protein